MDINGKHVAILVDDYFEQSEFEEPISLLKDAGAEITVIGVNQLDITGLNHAEKGDKFTADILLSQATSIDYDAVLLPGGVVNADSLRMNIDAQDFVNDFLSGGKPTALICHAPWILVSADLAEGRRLTSYNTIKDDIINAGGDWVNEPVVVDMNLITSRQPEDIPDFTYALIKMLSLDNSLDAADPSDTMEAINERRNELDRRLTELGYSKQRDQISVIDEDDILADEDLTDVDQLHPSSVTPYDEKTDTY